MTEATPDKQTLPPDLSRLKQAEQWLQAEEQARPNRPGRQSARESLKALFDSGTGQELFRFVRNRLDKPSFSDGIVCASGEIQGRPLLAWASEYETMGGSIGAL